MSPDPFDRLEGIHPPDQWDDITRRSAAPDDLVVDLTAARPPRRRALGVAAAALVVLALGAAVLAVRGGDDDGLTTAATDPTAPAVGPTVPGTCPFALASSDGLPPLEPGRTPVENAEVAPAEADVTWGHLTVDELPIEVVVAGTDSELSVRADQGVGIDSIVVDAFAVGEPRVTVEGWEVVADEGPCSSVHVYAHVPLRVDDPVVAEAATTGVPPSEAELAPYVDIARPTIERVRNAVVLLGADAAGATATTEGPVEDACPFTLADPVLPALTAKEPDDEAPFTLLDGVTDRWQRAEVDGMVVLVGVGGRGDGPIEEPGQRWVADEADYDTGARRAMVRANEGLAPAGSCTDAVVHVLFPLSDAEVTSLEAGATVQPDITAAVALAERVLDVVVLSPTDVDARDEELSRRIQEEAAAYQARLACLAQHPDDPAACDDLSTPTTTTAPAPPLAGTPCPFTLDGVDGAGPLTALPANARELDDVDPGQPSSWAEVEVDGRRVTIGVGAPTPGSTLDGAEVGDFTAGITDATGSTATGSALLTSDGPCSAATVLVEGSAGDGLAVSDLGAIVLGSIVLD